MGIGNVRETAGTAVTVIVTNGTAAAAGTLGYFGVATGLTAGEDFGDAGFYADLNATLGFKTVAGGATVAMTLVGREEKF